MLAGRAFKRVRPFEPIGTSNLHLPPVIRLRTDNRNPPIPAPIRKRVLDDRNNLRPSRTHATRVMHLHRNCHTSENITTSSAPANHAPPAQSPKAAYDRALW